MLKATKHTQRKKPNERIRKIKQGQKKARKTNEKFEHIVSLPQEIGHHIELDNCYHEVDAVVFDKDESR
ncbi:MAG: hypothetical protein KDK56_01080, partial [Simkania sp.]|nr:hypothetical protein [Simkania sp.]